MPASSGKIRGDANSLKNQPLAIDACIISKPLAVIATVRRPNGNSDTALIPKRMIASGFYKFIKSWISDIKKPPGSPHTTRGCFNCGHSETRSKSELNAYNDAPSSFAMANLGKTTWEACPACPQMIITNGQQQSSLCCYIFITIY